VGDGLTAIGSKAIDFPFSPFAGRTAGIFPSLDRTLIVNENVDPVPFVLSAQI
jgi:hypothetical protein